MANVVQPTQKQILDWVRERWPEYTTPVWRAVKLGEETGETIGAVLKESLGYKTEEDVRKEAAQTAICLMGLAESMGFDLDDAIADEWIDMQTRKWS